MSKKNLITPIKDFLKSIGGKDTDENNLVDAIKDSMSVEGKELVSVIENVAGGGGGQPDYKAMLAGLIDGTIENLVIPEGVTSIKENAFDNYTGLKSVTIPSSVTSIENNAFGNIHAGATIRCGFSQYAVSGAPWGANSATIVYDYTPESESNAE